jgi:uncharacterized protein YndB with AHSA1/START domain
MPPEKVKTTEITVSRTVRGSSNDVFDVWMDPKSPGGMWFGVARLILNPVVDGLFYHVVGHAGKQWAHYGRFIRLDRGRAVEFTWVSEATKGLESIVSVTFVPSDGATEVTLRHTNVPDDAAGREHEAGWSWVLGAIAERFDKVNA